jgi:hypothetical protein
MDDMMVKYFNGVEFGKLQQFGVMGIHPVFNRKSGIFEIKRNTDTKFA